ncbi:putative DNA polymerase epsilon catalytic subunit [Cryptosporidium serpentis]
MKSRAKSNARSSEVNKNIKGRQSTFSKRKRNLDKIFDIKLQKVGIESREIGYLYNVQSSAEYISEENNFLGDYIDANNNEELIESFVEHACLYLYFVNKRGETFKSPFFYRPYFFLETDLNTKKHWFINNLENKYRDEGLEADIVEKDDLTLSNHLIGEKKELIKVSFNNVKNLVAVRNEILLFIKENKKKKSDNNPLSTIAKLDDFSLNIIEIYEYDILYSVRVLIDNNISIGMWYEVIRWTNELLELKLLEKDTSQPDLRCLAWDIETTKEPLKFPNVEIDEIMMISCVFEGQGYLIVNRNIVSSDISDFEYSPKPEFTAPFSCINCENEETLIRYYVKLVQKLRPHVISSYNGDNFDFPFLLERGLKYGLYLTEQWGVIRQVEQSGGSAIVGNSKTNFLGTNMLHLDCFRWVERDSYLPCGSRSLKSVTKDKLRYNPVELDPELMVPYARENPELLAEYSVSDAVATYYLYKTYVHRFIFALATIIPLPGEELLRRGTGTLCEHLLMKEAFKKNILFPNKKITESMEFHENRPILNSTYVGGTVEALCSGIFRSDIPELFSLDTATLDILIKDLDSTLKFGIEKANKKVEDCTNYQDVKDEILQILTNLKKNNKLSVNPLIYHLDVAAMYPNIILTNRLQPTAIVSDDQCRRCTFYSEANKCQRIMNWRWKGDVFPISKGEMDRIIKYLKIESFDMNSYKIKYDDDQNSDSDGSNNEEKSENLDITIAGNVNSNKVSNKSNGQRSWDSLTARQQSEILIQRLKKYCSKVYRRQTVSIEETRSSIVCQRENSFYVDTVRCFRDRRYIYKDKKKDAEEKLRQAELKEDIIAIKSAQNEELLYESLQLAHKCILNSFYGYVMRRGSRWFSMEMAAIVTWLGGNVIREARVLVENIGRVLELDTDGIWAILPGGFPNEITFKFKDESKKKIHYVCTLLNYQVHKNWTNDQYLDFDPISKKYIAKVENSIYFEVDGPYKCFFIPASDKQDKLLKKRYAVYGFDNKLKELKGFELKRRGELQLIKILQEEIFPAFLHGSSKQEAYESVARTTLRWLNLIETRGSGILDDEQLFYLISETKNMSKSVEQMGSAKSMAITTARRLFEFLQNPSYLVDKNVACKFIVSEYPKGEDKSQRAIPLSIFSAPLETKAYWLSKWLRLTKVPIQNKEDNNKLHDCESKSQLKRDIYNKSGEIAMIENKKLKGSNWDVRNILDWSYYKKRLINTILKIVIIPAIYQGVSNPLPDLPLPTWVKNQAELSGLNQQKISQYFSIKKTNSESINQETNLSKPQCQMPTQEKDIDEVYINDLENSKIEKKISNLDMLELGKEFSEEMNAKDVIQELEKTSHINKVLHTGILSKSERSKLLQTNFKNWLRYQTRRWLLKYESLKQTQVKINKKVENEMVDTNVLKFRSKLNQTNNKGVISSYAFLTKGYLQILDIYPFNTSDGNQYHGHYNILLYSESCRKMYVAPFEFSRKFLVASSVPIKLAEDTKDKKFSCRNITSEKELPRGVAYNYLMEVRISENLFVESKSSLICNSSTIGIYEANIPLEFTILESLGNIIESNTPNIANCVKENGMIRDNIWRTDFNSSSRYCKNISWIFLSIVNLDDKLCLLLSDWKTKDCFVFMAGGQQIENSKLLGELSKAIKSFDINFNPKEAYYFNNAKIAFNNLNLCLNKIANEKNDPCILLIHSTLPKYEILKYKENSDYNNWLNYNGREIQCVEKITERGTFDIISVPFMTVWLDTHDDSESKISRFDWHQQSILICLKKTNEYVSKTSLIIELSKVLNVPVLYILYYRMDLAFFIFDIIYSRYLHSKNLVSWASNDIYPDLGHPKLVSAAKNDWDLFRIGSDISSNINSENDFIEVVNPGIYRSYGAQLDFQQWILIEAVRNCIILAEIFDCIEFSNIKDEYLLGSKSNKKCKSEFTSNNNHLATLEYFGKKEKPRSLSNNLLIQPLHHHSSLSTPKAFLCLKETLQYLRSIVEKLISSQTNEESVINTNNVFSEFIINVQEQFYRWLCSPQSLMFDPALVRMTKSYSSKFFKVLQGELSNLDIKIVYGNIRRIVLTTNLNRIEDESRQYFKQMMELLNNKPLFSGLSLVPIIEYKALLQIDKNNYFRRTLDPENPYDIHLSILNYLPINTRQFILDEISDFLMLPIRKTREMYQLNPQWNDSQRREFLLNKILDLYGSYSEKIQQINEILLNPALIINKYGIREFFDPLDNVDYENYESNKVVKINNLPFMIHPGCKNSLLNYPNITTNNDKSSGDFINESSINKNIFFFPTFIGRKHLNSLANLRLDFELAYLFLNIFGLDQCFAPDGCHRKDYEHTRYIFCQTVGISEFHSRIQDVWQVPFNSFIIKDLICPNCLGIDDLDLIGSLTLNEELGVRDLDLDGSTRKFISSLCWKCIYCNIPIDTHIIEERLTIEFYERLTAIQCQDVICKQCKAVKVGKLSNSTCSYCMGDFTTRLFNLEEFKNFFSIIKSIATYFEKQNEEKRNTINEFEAIIQISKLYADYIL